MSEAIPRAHLSRPRRGKVQSMSPEALIYEIAQAAVGVAEDAEAEASGWCPDDASTLRLAAAVAEYRRRGGRVDDMPSASWPMFAEPI